MTLRRHLTSTLILTGITLNLLLWIIPLVLIVALQALIRYRRFHRLTNSLVDAIYRTAVSIDSFLLERVLKIQILIDGAAPEDRENQYIIVSNHRSWFDILILQHIVSRRGPMLKFLIKRELSYVPIVGWICLALDFPRLSRGQTKDSREKDLASVAAAAASLTETSGALTNFAEGTRFSAAKQLAQQSPYRHLLRPKTGGLRIMMESLPAEIIDVTLIYPIDGINFWGCLSGRLEKVQVILKHYALPDVADVGAWLNARWAEKDAAIDAAAIRRGD